MRADETVAHSGACSVTCFLNTQRITENVKMSQKSSLWRAEQSHTYRKFTQAILQEVGLGVSEKSEWLFLNWKTEEKEKMFLNEMCHSRLKKCRRSLKTNKKTQNFED